MRCEYPKDLECYWRWITDIIGFDTLSALNALVAHPEANGLHNVTDPCFNATTGSVCAYPDKYLFWDSVHPTAHVHDIPQTSYLLGVGLLIVAGWRAWLRRGYLCEAQNGRSSM